MFNCLFFGCEGDVQSLTYYVVFDYLVKMKPKKNDLNCIYRRYILNKREEETYDKSK